jgi:hypothetical protein
MAASIAVSPEHRWSSASWLFDWVLRTVAEQAADAELTARLTEIVDNNLGWLGLDELPDPQRQAFTAVLPRLPDLAGERLPPDLASRDQALESVRTLSRLAAARPQRPASPGGDPS